MPMSTEGALARLTGHIAIEEAEALAEWLRATPDATLDLAGCEGLHSAALQLLLAAPLRLVAAPPDPWLAALLPHPAAEVPR
jgi:hypothetical protein